MVIASHHTVDTLTNPLVGTGGEAERRVLGDEVLALLLQHPQVVAWVNGHTHRNQAWAHRSLSGKGGLWELDTAAHVDWPMQSRLVEVVDNQDGTLSVFATILDHDGPAAYGGRTGGPVPLAGLARELAANDWHEAGTQRRGLREAHNVELLVPCPGVPALRVRSWRSTAARTRRRSRSRGCRAPWSGCPSPPAGGRTPARPRDATRSTSSRAWGSAG